MRSQSVLAKNRQSPVNEDRLVEAYKKAYPISRLEDNYDIAAVITMSGLIGHAMMYSSYNRSHDNQYHMCYNFITDDELVYYM